MLLELEREKVLVFTPARRVGGKRVVCYDDRYIIKLASETGGIVVSNDHYKDLVNENPDFKKVIEERLLMYSFVNDRFVLYACFYGRVQSFRVQCQNEKFQMCVKIENQMGYEL